MRLVSFDDFEAYGNALESWSFDLRKLNAGPFRGNLFQMAVGPVRMAYVRHNAALEVSGSAPPGFRSFGLPMPASPPGIWSGTLTSSRTVSVFDPSGSIEAMMPPGFETVVFSVSAEHLDLLGGLWSSASASRFILSAEENRREGTRRLRARHWHSVQLWTF